MSRKLGGPCDYFWRVRPLLPADTFLLLRKLHHLSWVLLDAGSGLPCVGIRSVFVGMALGTLCDVTGSR